MSDGVAQDLWILSIGIDNNPWVQYQALNVTAQKQNSCHSDESSKSLD
jgi:hypothetical protein